MKHGQFWWPLAAAAVAAVAVGTATTRAQGQPAPNARNDHPNPYSTVEGWVLLRLPVAMICAPPAFNVMRSAAVFGSR